MHHLLLHRPTVWPTLAAPLAWRRGGGLLTTMAAPSPDELSALTVKQLKEKLREAGLPVSGVKAVLIDRLLCGPPPTPPTPAPSAPPLAADAGGVLIEIEHCKS